LWGVTILTSVNKNRLKTNKSGSEIIDKVIKLTSLAKDYGLYTIFMAGDSTRTQPEFLQEVIVKVQENCDELCIADSFGAISPFGYRYLVEQVNSWTELPISVHCHNHTSLAVANALAAVLGGASVIQTCVNGMGELSGVLPLEEIAVALPIHLGISTGIKLEGLKSLSDLVANVTGVPTNIQKPAVGDYTFAIPETWVSEAFISKLKDSSLNENVTYPPEIVGNKAYLPIGHKCNEYTIRYHLGNKGWDATASTIQEIVKAVRLKAAEAKGYYLMDEAEFFKMIQEQGYELTLIKKK
ncbi:hypothetical protein ACFL0D_08225, partial [Thermoproteota archaeon]